MSAILTEQFAELQFGDHLCFLYDEVDEVIAAAAPFLALGLTRQERCVFVTGELPIDRIVGGLTEAGVNVPWEQERGALELIQTWMLPFPPGDFGPEAMVAALRQLVSGAVARGFTGLWLVIDMTWMVVSGLDPSQWIEFESRLTGVFAALPIVAICTYNRRRFPPTILRDALQTHPLAVLDDLVCPNIYYEPPELFLARNPVARQVEWMSSQLLRARHAQQEHDQLIRAEAALAERKAMERIRAEFIAALAQAEERQRFAMDLHDGVVQSLFAVALGLALLEQLPPEELTRVRTGVVRARGQIDEIIREIRSYIEGLPKSAAGTGGLQVELAALVEEFGLAMVTELQLRPGPAVFARIEATLGPGGIEEVLQVAREALANSARHARASMVSIRLEEVEDQLVLTVRDNGRGFNLKMARKGEGAGLRNMTERARRLGGRLRVRSTPGKGSQVRLVVPMPKPPGESR